MFNPRMGGPGMPPPGFEEPKGFGSPLDEILMSLQRQDVPFFFMQNSHFIEIPFLFPKTLVYFSQNKLFL
jgi:hypothetical protein